MLGGAIVAESMGWRMAFVIFGLPGLLMGLLVAATIKEPLRAAPPSNNSMWTDINAVWRLPGFLQIACAGALTGLAGYGLGAWSPSFLIRTHGLSLIEAGVLLGVTGAVGGIFGAVIGGILCDRLSQHDLRWQLWFPALGAFASAPMMFAFVMWPESQAWSIGDFKVPAAMIFMLFGGIIAAFWVGPTYAAIQNLAPENMRTQASALFLFMFNLVGLGLGPLVIGIASDALAPSMGSDSLRYAMAAGLSAVLLGGFLFWRAAPLYRSHLLTTKTQQG